MLEIVETRDVAALTLGRNGAVLPVLVAQWALEAPARWNRWAVPCPIRADECFSSKKNRHQ